MSDTAKFKYSAQDGVLEIEGSEEFISKHFEGLTDIVRVMARRAVVDQTREISAEPGDQAGAEEPSEGSGGTPESIASYPEFYSEINGKLRIVCEVPGASKQAQMKNAALLYCYGSSLMGDELIPSKDIRGVCEDHGFLDGGNFASIFGDKTLFLSDGVRGGNKDVKLTFLGRKKAKELLAGG